MVESHPTPHRHGPHLGGVVVASSEARGAGVRRPGEAAGGPRAAPAANTPAYGPRRPVLHLAYADMPASELTVRAEATASTTLATIAQARARMQRSSSAHR